MKILICIFCKFEAPILFDKAPWPQIAHSNENAPKYKLPILQPSDPPTFRPADSDLATLRPPDPSDLPTLQSSIPSTLRPANFPIFQPSDIATCRPSDLPTCRPADPPICRPAGLATLRPPTPNYNFLRGALRAKNIMFLIRTLRANA